MRVKLILTNTCHKIWPWDYCKLEAKITYFVKNVWSVWKLQYKIVLIFENSKSCGFSKREDHGYLTTFRDINAPKSGPFKYENNAQTLPKQLQNNFEKVQKSTFLTPKWSKMTPQIGQNEQNFDPKFKFSRSFIELWSSKYIQK